MPDGVAGVRETFGTPDSLHTSAPQSLEKTWGDSNGPFVVVLFGEDGSDEEDDGSSGGEDPDEGVSEKRCNCLLA